MITESASTANIMLVPQAPIQHALGHLIQVSSPRELSNLTTWLGPLSWWGPYSLSVTVKCRKLKC